jgi:hypothetical protein
MSELQFRGRDNATCKWYTGELVGLAKAEKSKMIKLTKAAKKVKIRYVNGVFWASNHIEYAEASVEPLTVSQLTTVVDKNGKGVFEGDLLLDRDGYDWFVTRDNNGEIACVGGNPGPWRWVALSELDGTCEIVGNQYEGVTDRDNYFSKSRHFVGSGEVTQNA